MRDYVQIIHDLRQKGESAAADALDELCTMARRMTALGIDLEAQIQEDFEPDFFVATTDTGVRTDLVVPSFIMKPETLKYLYDHVGNNVPFKMVACKEIGDTWFVFQPDAEQPEQFLTEEADLQFIQDREK
jgi:hypothetical protein